MLENKFNLSKEYDVSNRYSLAKEFSLKIELNPVKLTTQEKTGTAWSNRWNGAAMIKQSRSQR